MGNELSVVVGGALAPIVKLITASNRLLGPGPGPTPTPAPSDDPHRAGHVDDAARFLREALHFHRFNPTSMQVATRARRAGAAAAYAGATADEVIAAAFEATAPALDVELIGSSFERARRATLDLLAETSEAA